MKTLEDLRKLDNTALLEERLNAQKELAKVSFEVKTGHSKRGDLIKKHKKYLAQVETVLKESTLKPTK